MSGQRRVVGGTEGAAAPQHVGVRHVGWVEDARGRTTRPLTLSSIILSLIVLICSTISHVSRLRLRPSLPVAQNVHPMAQPA